MTLHQTKVDGIQRGFVGDLASLSRLTESDDLPHTAAKATQVVEVTVDSAANSTLYSYEVNGEVIEFTSDASATLAEISAGLVAAHNANIVARGLALAEDGTGSLTLTASFANQDVLDVSTTDANLSVAVDTAPGGWEDIPFGRAIVESSGQAALPAGGASASDFVGIAKRVLDEESPDLNKPSDSYSSSRPVVFVTTGDVYVEGGDSASRGDDVYIGTDSDEAGKFFTADNSGTTRVQITDGSFSWRRANVIRVKKGL